MNNEYIKIFKDIDKINKQLSIGKKQYSYKKHIQSKMRNNQDIYATKKNKTYRNNSEYVFLLDNTGSMEGGRRQSIQNKLLVQIISCLEVLNKKFAVYGFSSDYEACERAYFKYAHHYAYIPIEKMHEVGRVDKKRLVNTINNVDWSAQQEFINLQMIYDDILEYKRKNRKNNRVNIIMFSDGGCTGMRNLLKSVINNIVLNASKTNVYLYIFNIENNDFGIYGKISAKIESEKDVPREFRKLIKKSELYNE